MGTKTAPGSTMSAAISYATVLYPSAPKACPVWNGVRLLTGWKPNSSTIRSVSGHRRAVSTGSTTAPYALRNDATAGGSSDEPSTTQRSPARAAYAAAEAPWLPEEATTTPGAPAATAALTVMRLSRSLWLHVGLRDSSLTYAPSPIAISGVPPSPSPGAASGGSRGAQRSRPERGRPCPVMKSDVTPV